MVHGGGHGAWCMVVVVVMMCGNGGDHGAW